MKIIEKTYNEYEINQSIIANATFKKGFLGAGSTFNAETKKHALIIEIENFEIAIESKQEVEWLTGILSHYKNLSLED